MKKYMFYSFLSAALLTLASCNEDFNEDVAAPQEWPQEEAITIPGFTASAVNASDLASAGDSITVFTYSQPSLPEGTTLGHFRLDITPTGIDNAATTQINADFKGQIATAELQALIEQAYGKRPVERTLNAQVYADIIKDGQASLLTCDPIVIKATPKAPYISQTYYIIGAPSQWDVQCTTLPFTHSEKDVYEDPVFTVTFPVSDGEVWFAITDDKSIAYSNENGGSWDWVLGCAEGDGNNGMEGGIARRYEIGNDGSWKVVVDGDAAYLSITINMMDYTYSIKKIVPEYYIVGDMQGWNTSAMTCMLYPKEGMTYTYTTQFNGYANLKLWLGSDFGNWDACYGCVSDGDNSASGTLVSANAGAIVCPEIGSYYTFEVDFSTMTYQWIKLDNQEPTSYDLIGLIGTFNGWGGDAELTQVSPHNWYIAGLEIPEAENNGIKFRANSNWDVSWGTGADLSHDLSVEPNGIGATNGGNLKVTPGTYNVFFNDITGEFVFKAL